MKAQNTFGLTETNFKALMQASKRANIDKKIGANQIDWAVKKFNCSKADAFNLVMIWLSPAQDTFTHFDILSFYKK